MNYFLRGIDPALWRRVKAQAERDGRTVRSTLLRFLETYAPKAAKKKAVKR